MFAKVSVTALLVGAAVAYHEPVGEPTGNPITAPLTEVVPACKPYTIQWTPTTSNKVSIRLMKGPSTNVIFNQVIVDGIDNTGSFTWTPPSNLEATEGPAGYGLQLIDDVNGQYQWSTQFGISLKDCGAEPEPKPEPKPEPSSVEPAATSSEAPAPTEAASGYPVSEPAPAVPSSAYEHPVLNGTSSYCSTSTVYEYVTAPAGVPSGVAPPSTIVMPTGPVTVPESLKTSATGYPTGGYPTGGYPVGPSSPPEFTGAASGLKAGLSLAAAVAAFAFML